MLDGLMAAGVSSLLDGPVLREISRKGSLKALRLLHDHFVLHTHEIGQAFQDSYSAAMVTICLGLTSEQSMERMWDRVVHGIRQLTQSRINREFAVRVETEYFQPYLQRRGIAGQSATILRRQLIRVCGELAQQNSAVLPIADFPEVDLAALLSRAPSFEITSFLLERTRTQQPLDRLLEDFLREQELLGDAVLYFFREQLRRDARVEKTLAALQREGLWADVHNIQEAQDQMSLALSQQLNQLQGQIATYRSMSEQAQRDRDQAMQELVENRLQQFIKQQRKCQQQLREIPRLLLAARQEWEQSWGHRLQRMETNFQQWVGIWQQHRQGILSQLDSLDEKLHDVKLAIHDNAQQLQASHELIQETNKDVLRARKAAEHVMVDMAHAHDLLQGMDQRLEQGFQHFEEVTGQVAGVSDAMHALVEMMRHMQLAPMVKARDEFSQHQGFSLRVIQDAVQELPRHQYMPHFSKTAIVVGSALSSSGALQKAEELFEQAYQQGNTDQERALAAYDLFQIRLRQKQWDSALEALKQATLLDRERYLLFDVDKYVPLEILGAGGMGCAFLCYDEWNERKVVVKCFWEATFGSLQEVFQEAYLMRKIASDAVPRPLDRGYAYPARRAQPYIVMEHIEGTIDGERYLEKHGPLSVAQGLHIAKQIARGLMRAHMSQICHLDLKPANLLFLHQNGGEILEAKIIDFGLARVARSIRHEAIAKTRGELSLMGQQIFGSLDYAPPEQMGDARYGEPGPHSDIFSFGATLYRLMSHESPRTLNSKYMPPETPNALYDLLCDCMIQDPARRPESMQQILRQLESIHAEVRRSPGQRFRERLVREFHQTQVIKPDAEANLLAEGRFCGLSTQEARQVLHDAMLEQFVQFERDLAQDSFALSSAAEERQEALRRQRFHSLYQEAISLVQQDPDQAKLRLQRAEQIAPDLIDETFKQWQRELNIEEVVAEEQNQPWMRQGITAGARIQLLDLPQQAAMVWVPPGQFVMGSPAQEAGRYKDEGPQTEVHITAGFWIWETPVTVGQFETLMGYRPEGSEDTPDDFPVDMLSWHEAAAFSDALSKRYQLPTTFDLHGQGRDVQVTLKSQYRGNQGRDYTRARGFRLPTEAEWEYAARAGSQAPQYGALTHIAWTEENAQGCKHAVAQKSPNANGLYDMLGNVWEWCWDWYGAYRGSTDIDPVGPASGSFRVKRGGSWSYSSRLVRAAFRNRLYSNSRDEGLGFRPIKVIR